MLLCSCVVLQLYHCTNILLCRRYSLSHDRTPHILWVIAESLACKINVSLLTDADQPALDMYDNVAAINTTLRAGDDAACTTGSIEGPSSPFEFYAEVRAIPHVTPSVRVILLAKLYRILMRAVQYTPMLASASVYSHTSAIRQHIPSYTNYARCRWS